MEALRVTLADLPRPARYAVLGGLGLGVVGIVLGVVVGLFVHRATAWAAAVEVGLPATVVGFVVGLGAGLVGEGLTRRRS